MTCEARVIDPAVICLSAENLLMIYVERMLSSYHLEHGHTKRPHVASRSQPLRLRSFKQLWWPVYQSLGHCLCNQHLAVALGCKSGGLSFSPAEFTKHSCVVSLNVDARRFDAPVDDAVVVQSRKPLGYVTKVL